MRARNREINIFNMSLLDILTGMLGAFLFLMLALLPYYAKVSKQKPEDVQALKQENQQLRDQVQLQQQQIADLQKQLDELQKIVKQSAGGPMTADQIQQLMDQLNQARQQLDQLRAQVQQGQNQTQQLQAQNDQMQQQMQQVKQDLQDMTKDRDWWQQQTGNLTLNCDWDSAQTDIDIMVMSPDGKIFGQKTEKLLGRDVIALGDDSHVNPKKPFNNEGVLTYLEKPGDYLVFYRVPKGADPATYAHLHGSLFFYQIMGKKLGTRLRADQLPVTKSSLAAPGGLYAWATVRYFNDKPMVEVHPAPAKLPPGIIMPEDSHMPTPTPAPHFPFDGSGTPSPSPAASPASSTVPIMSGTRRFPFGAVGHPLHPGTSITPPVLPPATPHP